MKPRGFCAIGVVHGKSAVNIGTLWRTAQIMEVDYIFTVGRRYKRQASDVLNTWRHVPLFHFRDMRDLKDHMPHDALLIGVEMDGHPLAHTMHPERAVYLLGAEDHGLTSEAEAMCQRVVSLPGERSMNVAVAGSIVLYDRVVRGTHGHGRIMNPTERSA